MVCRPNSSSLRSQLDGSYGLNINGFHVLPLVSSKLLFWFHFQKSCSFYIKFSDPTIKHGVNAFKLKVLSSLSLGALV